MPRPLPGMVTIAEYGDRFTADLAAARLDDAGIDSAVLGDPASGIAPHHVTERWFALCVRAEMVDHARLALVEPTPAADPAPTLTYEDFLYESRSTFRRRPRWVRIMTWILIITIPVPILITSVLLVLAVARAMFP